MNKEFIFSIIIPTYNRPDRLSTCLQSLAKIDYPRDNFEVIIINDGSQMPLENYLIPFQKSLNISLISQPNSGPAKARNHGAFMAKGKYLAFTDDDCQPAIDWLRKLEAQFTITPDCLVGGKTINALPDNLYSTASQELIDYLYSYYNANAQKAEFFTSNNFALPTAYFQSIGGFDINFHLAAGEDREFCDRLITKGYSMVYNSEVIVYHAHHLTLYKFWRQHFNYGRGAFRFQQITVKRSRKQLQDPSFYLKLLTYPFSQGTGIKILLIAGLFLVSQVGVSMGLFWEKNSQQKRQN